MSKPQDPELEYEEENSLEVSWTELAGDSLAVLLDDLRARCDPKSHRRVLAIDLMENSLGPAGAAALCAVLSDELSPVEELRLRYNGLGKHGADELGSFLRVSTKLRVVDVRGNRLDASSAHALLKGASESSTLHELQLGSNNLGAAGAAKVSVAVQNNPVIGHLALPSNAVGSDGAAEIANALRHPECQLHVLDLANNAIGPEGAKAVFAALSGNRTLARLFMGQNPLGDDPLPELRDALFASHIVHLDIRSCGLTDVGLLALHEGVSSSGSLHHISIAGNRINGASVGFERFCLACSKSDTLTEVDMASCAIGQAGASNVEGIIENAPALTALNLAFNEIDDAGAETLARAINAAKRRLASLDLTGNVVTDQGASMLLTAVQNNPNITGMSLHGNPGCSRPRQAELDKKLQERKPAVQTVF